MLRGPLCAKTRHMRCSKFAAYSITSSARASNGRRHVEAERLGGLEVDQQFVLCWRLHRQIGGLLTLEDAVNIAGRSSVLVEKVRPIGSWRRPADSGSDVVPIPPLGAPRGAPMSQALCLTRSAKSLTQP